MLIKQARVTSKFFRSGFLQKFNLREYNSIKQPAIFFGIYIKSYPTIFRHEGLAVLIWTGGDSMNLAKNPALVKKLKSRDNIKHIAISNFVSNDLDRVNIPHYFLPILPFNNNNFRPAPLGDCIYTYSAHTKPQFYGSEKILLLKKIFPDIRFITLYAKQPNSVIRSEIINYYKKCFIGLRLTPHDGMSNTVIEMGLMGRKVVWNGNSPNAIPYKNIDDIVNAIKCERNLIGETRLRMAEKVKEFIDIPNDWLYTKFYK
jgi:hypothetical protein